MLNLHVYKLWKASGSVLVKIVLIYTQMVKNLFTRPNSSSKNRTYTSILRQFINPLIHTQKAINHLCKSTTFPQYPQRLLLQPPNKILER